MVAAPTLRENTMRMHPKFESSSTPRNRNGLLAAAAALVLIACNSASAAPHPMPAFAGARTGATLRPCPVNYNCLWDQNSSDTGIAIDSQNFTSGTYTQYNSADADDFTVPTGTTMTVSAVDVTGQYYNGVGSPPASSFDVTFYKDAVVNGVDQPGVVKKAFTDIPYVATTGTPALFSLGLCVWNNAHTICHPRQVNFSRGPLNHPHRYWVSVVANCNFAGGCGQWGWELRSPIYGTTSPAVFENPNNGFSTGCTTWNTLNSCLGYTNVDFMFDLR